MTKRAGHFFPLFLLALILAGACPALAADAPSPDGKSPTSKGYKSYDLGEVVVEASGDTSRDISISNTMNEVEIQATGAHTVAQALAFAPGVVLTGNRKGPEITIHGFGQERILVLIDGVPYQETNYGKLDLDQIPVDIVSKIIVTKGAPSVLYGPDALGGVVNIITKKGGEGNLFVGRAELSERNTYKVSASAGGTASELNYFVNYTRRESDGWVLSDDYEPQVGAITRRPGGTSKEVIQGDGRRVSSDYTTDSLWARLGWEPNQDAEYFASFHWIETDKGMPPDTATSTVFPNRPAFSWFGRWDKYNDRGVDLSGKQKLSDLLTLRGKLFYHYHEDQYASYSDTTYNDLLALSLYEDYFTGGNLFADFTFNDIWTGSFSFLYRFNGHKQRDDAYLPMDEFTSQTGSLGTEHQVIIIPGLNLVAGVSLDWFEVKDAQQTTTAKNGDFVSQDDLATPDGETQVNPLVGLTWQALEGTRFYASVARKTRFPRLIELYSSKSGNPDLDSEKSLNYTLGVNQTLGSWVTMDLSGFLHDVSDFITTDGPYLDSTYRNYADVRLTGLEFQASSEPVTGLTLSLDYTYVQAEDQSPGRVTDDVTGVPEHKLGLGASYLIPLAEVLVDLRGIYVGKSWYELPTPKDPTTEPLENDDYIVFNARVSRQFGEHLELYAMIYNLMDEDYAYEMDNPAPGRTYWAGVKVAF